LSQTNAVTLSNSSTDSQSFTHFFLFGNSVTISNLQSSGTNANLIGVANGNPHMSQDNAQSPVTAAVTLTVNQTANTSFAGQIADALSDGYDGGSLVPGPLSLTMSGSGTLVLSGTNTYSGGTQVLEGTLVIAQPYSIPSGSVLAVGAGATSIFAGAAASSAPIVPSGALAAAVPEPSTFVLLAVAALAVLVAGLGAWRGRMAMRRPSSSVA
jgi:autotransporter-associated beta strand protein